MAKLGLLSPWAIYYNELKTFFEKDCEVTVIYDEENNVVNLYVNNSAKAAALTELLPVEKDFGAVTLKINVIPANDSNKVKLAAIKASFADEAIPLSELYCAALAGNKQVDTITVIRGIFNNPITYVVFKKCVVQYYNDSLGDINGVCSTLMQNIAEDIFEKREGIYFCTSTSEETENSFRF